MGKECTFTMETKIYKSKTANSLIAELAHSKIYIENQLTSQIHYTTCIDTTASYTVQFLLTNKARVFYIIKMVIKSLSLVIVGSKIEFMYECPMTCKVLYRLATVLIDQPQGSPHPEIKK